MRNYILFDPPREVTRQIAAEHDRAYDQKKKEAWWQHDRLKEKSHESVYDQKLKVWRPRDHQTKNRPLSAHGIS